MLFRESERFSLGLWLRHLHRDRGPTPSAAEGLFCGVLILVLSFVFRSVLPPPDGFAGFARVTLALQVATILAPALLMAVMLTSSPRQTLLLRLPRWKMVPAAAVLAVAMHPFVVALDSLVVRLYPIAPEMQAKLDDLQGMFASADVWTAGALGRRRAGGLRGAGLPRLHPFRTAAAWATTAGRSSSARCSSASPTASCSNRSTSAVGLVLGWLAVKSGSLLPGVVFHFLNNTMMVLATKVTPELIARYPVLGVVVHPTEGGPSYQWPVYVVCGVVGLALLAWFAWFQEGRKTEGVAQETYHPTRSIEGAAG